MSTEMKKSISSLKRIAGSSVSKSSGSSKVRRNAIEASGKSLNEARAILKSVKGR
jgi:hypothetical protein